MAKVEKQFEGKLAPAPQETKIEVNQGNVLIVAVQLLNDISIKLGKLLAIEEKNNG